MPHATRMEAIYRLGGELPFAVSAGTSKDDRRNKDYHRDVTVSLEVMFENTEERSQIPSCYRVGAVAKQLLREQGFRIHSDPDHADSACGAKLTKLQAAAYNQWSPATFHWSLRFSATRPSEIPAESTIVDWAREHLLPVLSRAFLRVAEEQREETRRKVAARQANSIGAWASRELLDRAKKATRYEQRLAALRAEMDAEIDVQAKRMREEGVIEAAAAEDDEDFEPEAIAYALDHFAERLGGWDRPFRSGTEWRMEHLFPEAGQGKDE